MEYSPATIVITDTAGTIEYVNPKFSELTGYTFDEAIGNNPRILRTAQTPHEHYAKLWSTISAGDEWHGLFQNRKKNGELYWESAIISPILNERGEITHHIAIKEDITERRRAEAKIEELNANLVERAAELALANQEFETFNYSVAHDLRNPLNVISS